MNAPVKTNAFKVTNLNGGKSMMDLSRQWISRPADQKFLSLSELRDATKASHDRSKESVVENRAFHLIAPEPKKIEDTHTLTVDIKGVGQAAFTHHSFNQLCGLAGAPAAYLRRQPSQTAADALSWDLRYNRGAESVKGYLVETGTDLLEMRAVNGPDYGRIPDYEVAEAVMQVAGNGTGDTRWKVPGVMDWRTMIYDPDVPVSAETTTLYASDRDVFMFLVDDHNPIEIGKARDGQPDLVFRGFYVRHSEVGTAPLEIAAFYLRSLCCNRIMWGVEGFERFVMRHTKYAPSRFVEEARPALQAFADHSTVKLLDAIKMAKEARVASDKDGALDFLAGRGMSRKRAVAVWDAVEQEEGVQLRTVWDAVQGITAVARTLPHADARFELECEAEKLLVKVAA